MSSLVSYGIELSIADIFDGLVGLSREALYHFLDDMSWWAIYWAIHSHIAYRFPKSGVTYWRTDSPTYPPKTMRCTTFWKTSWWAMYSIGHIAYSGTRFQIPGTGPQIWGRLLTKYHIWRISEDYPAKTKRCTTFWTTCPGELCIELSIAI